MNPGEENQDRGGWFRTTHWSVVLQAGQASSPDATAALEELCRSYWYPLYAYIRRNGHGPHDAEDLTQAFFASLLERNDFGAVHPDRGKFRSFLLASLNHFLGNERARGRAAKRGGGRPLLLLDEAAAEQLYALEPAAQTSPEVAFQRRWAVALLERAFASVRRDFAGAGKEKLFDRLKPFLEETPDAGDYEAAAEELGMTANNVAVAVHRLRQKYREAVRLEIAHTVSSADEIAQETRHLFAALAR